MAVDEGPVFKVWFHLLRIGSRNGVCHHNKQRNPPGALNRQIKAKTHWGRGPDLGHVPQQGAACPECRAHMLARIKAILSQPIGLEFGVPIPF